MSWALALQWAPGSRQLTCADLALDFESHGNRVLSARRGHRHARPVLLLREQARVLQEAVNLLQPVLGGGTLSEGSFPWMCGSLVPLGGFRSMGRTKWLVFACRPDMRHPRQQPQQRCLEL